METCESVPLSRVNAMKRLPLQQPKLQLPIWVELQKSSFNSDKDPKTMPHPPYLISCVAIDFSFFGIMP